MPLSMHQGRMATMSMMLASPVKKPTSPGLVRVRVRVNQGKGIVRVRGRVKG